jgi:hypothetical protein
MDLWLQQQDTRKLLEESPLDSQGFCTVYEKTESILQRRFILLIPLSKRQSVSALTSGHEFNRDMKLARLPIVRSANRHSFAPCISRRFWKYSKQTGIRAALDEKGEVLFDWWNGFNCGTQTTRIRVRHDLIQDDLVRHKLCGLWCIDSIRFSERTPLDLGMRTVRQLYRGKDFVYQFSVGHRPGHRLRMQTASFVMGKRLFVL